MQSIHSESGIELGYRPIVALSTCVPLGIEAGLCVRGSQFDDVLSRSEHCAFDAECDLSVWEPALARACRTIAELNRARTRPLYVSVYCPSGLLRGVELVRCVGRVLHVTKCAPSWLTLAVSEELFGADVPELRGNLHALSRLGVAVALSDFGFHHSSGKFFERHLIKTLKIDQSFIGDSTDRRVRRPLVRGFIRLANELGIDVIVDGVDTITQADELMTLGCRIAQGNLFGATMNETRLVAWQATHQ
ncbi:EAL domain-containing protein [Burkholderia ubonensis]|uniref:EAL domain-containing protein n=1 Tax=Burkholderia ubonensis TaxID=101571 RepID=UPI0009B43B93|nr:EAL domain-containing protein [Burkholderia ubonensis]